MVLTAYSRAHPGETGLCCLRRPAAPSVSDPKGRHRDHREIWHLPLGRQACTPLSSAALPIVERQRRPAVSRPSHPAPRIVTIRAKRPSCRDETTDMYILRFSESKIFGRGKSDGTIGLKLRSKFIFSRGCFGAVFTDGARRTKRNRSTDLPVGQISCARLVGQERRQLIHYALWCRKITHETNCAVRRRHSRQGSMRVVGHPRRFGEKACDGGWKFSGQSCCSLLWCNCLHR
jgi:hypothetical protein